MGFGAGFGEAFSKSFENQRQRSHERETDAFRYRMETFVKNKDKYDKYKQEDSQYAGLAKDIVQNTNAPPEAIGKAYGMLKNGATYDDVMKVFQSGKFKVTKAAEDQTDAAIPPPPQDTTQPAAPAPGMDGGGLLSQVFPGMKKFGGGQQGVEQRVQDTTGMSPEEISQIDAGYTPPDMNTGNVEYTPDPSTDLPKDIDEATLLASDAKAALMTNPSDPTLKTASETADRRLQAMREQKIIQGDIDSHQGTGESPTAVGGMDMVRIPNPKYDPKDPTSNRVIYGTGTFDGAGHYLDADGNIIPGAQARSKAERDDLAKLGTELAKPAKDIQDKSLAIAGMLRTGAAMRGTVERSQGGVLQDWTSAFAKFGQALTGEGAAAADILSKAEEQNIEEINPAELESAVRTLQDVNKAYQKSPAGQLAQESLLFKAQATLFSYYYGMSLNQTGRSLQQKEQEMFEKMSTGGNDPHQFYQVLAGNLFPMMKQVEAEGSALANNTNLATFKAQWGGVPDIYNPQPVDTYVKGDKAVKDLMATLAPYEGSSSGADVTPSTEPPPEAPPAEGQKQQFNSPQDVDAAVAAGTLKSGDTFLDANGKERTVP